MYQAYKPLRNRLAKLNLESGLIAIWEVYCYVSGRRPLSPNMRPTNHRHGDELNILQWQLQLLAREVLLNCSSSSKELFTWNSMAHSLNQITAIQNSISEVRYQDKDGAQLIWADIHAIVHQQLPLQRKHGVERMVRFANIFGTDKLDELLKTKVGLTFMECVFLTFACVGNFERVGHLWKDQKYDEFGISDEKVSKFFAWVSRTPVELRKEIEKLQSYDENWSYTWNPLEGTPLVTVGELSRPAVISPVPSLMWNRLSSAIFFDLVVERGFDKIYGAAFENHVGTFAKTILPGPFFTVKGEAIYKIGKVQKHGLDWYLTDGGANLLVECKTKRVTVAAKTLNEEVLFEELDVLAKSVVQLYKNAIDFIGGKTRTVFNQKKCYLAVVTLEEWHLVSLSAVNVLRRKVLDRLETAGLDRGLIDTMPYTVLSCEEFERMLSAMRVLGIDAILKDKFTAEFSYMPMDSFLMRHAVQIQASYKETYEVPFRALLARMSANMHPAYRDKVRFDHE